MMLVLVLFVEMLLVLLLPVAVSLLESRWNLFNSLEVFVFFMPARIEEEFVEI